MRIDRHMQSSILIVRKLATFKKNPLIMLQVLEVERANIFFFVYNKYTIMYLPSSIYKLYKNYQNGVLQICPQYYQCP